MDGGRTILTVSEKERESRKKGGEEAGYVQPFRGIENIKSILLLRIPQGNWKILGCRFCTC